MSITTARADLCDHGVWRALMEWWYGAVSLRVDGWHQRRAEERNWKSYLAWERQQYFDVYEEHFDPIDEWRGIIGDGHQDLTGFNAWAAMTGEDIGPARHAWAYFEPDSWDTYWEDGNDQPNWEEPVFYLCPPNAHPFARPVTVAEWKGVCDD